ncbi:MAG: glycosyltransferase family 2 protein [Nanoarchaeota archaeon]|nr:glycosyltransferase family 2 protein [Nanoarchaeota archaeon]
MVKYSLIVPVYNEEKRIAACLKSLRAQAYKDHEIIVVNNNSTDKSIEIAKKYAKHITNEKKQGYIHAVNKGVKKSKGEFIASCDADSVYPKNWLKKIDAKFNSNKNIVGVYGSLKILDSMLLVNMLSYHAFCGWYLLCRLYGVEHTSGANFAFRKQAFHKIGGYNPNDRYAGPDLYLGKRLAQEGIIIQDLSNYVYTSMRRINNNFIKEMYYELVLISAIKKGHKPKRTIKQYEDYRNS